MRHSLAFVSKVERDITRATGIRRAPSYKNLFRWRVALLEAVAELPEKEWRLLSEDTKKWYVEACQALKNKQKLPPFPDEDEIEIKRRQAYGSAYEKKHKNFKINYKGAGYRAKEIMIKEGMYFPLMKLHKRLQEEGYIYSPRTLQIVIAEFRSAVRVLQDHGLLKCELNWDRRKKHEEQD